MKKLTVAVIALSSISISTSIAASAPKPGTKCAKAGQTQIFTGIKYTCTKLSGKLTWNKGVAVPTVAKPTAAPKPAPTTTDEQAKILRVIATAKSEGSYYQELTSCHSYEIIAVLQRQVGQSWIDVAPVQGWLKIGTTCFQPWTVYRSPTDQVLRWRLADRSGAWEVFSDPFTENKIL